MGQSLHSYPIFGSPSLTAIRYAINEKDQIRSIAHPDQEFHFFISKNERVKEVQREAMDSRSTPNLISFNFLGRSSTIPSLHSSRTQYPL